MHIFFTKLCTEYAPHLIVFCIPRSVLPKVEISAAPRLASQAGVFRGARISLVGREEIRAPLKTPAWDAAIRPGKLNKRGHWKRLNEEQNGFQEA